MSDAVLVPDQQSNPRPANVIRAGDAIIDAVFDFPAAVALYQELESGSVSTAFQTRLWIECWQAQLASRRDALVFFCSVKDAQGRQLLLLPLCIRNEGRLRAIEGADLGVSDYIAPIMAAHFSPTPAEWSELWRQIVAALPPHDVLRLTKIPLNIRDRPNPLAWIPGRIKLDLQAHGVAIGSPWDSCAKRIFSNNRREKLKKGWRRLATFGDVSFRVVENADEMARLFEELAAQRIRRFAVLQRNDPLRDRNFHDFYRAIILRGAASGFARLTLITVGDRIAAMQFGVCHAGAFHVLVPTFFDGPWLQSAPGMLLASRTMQWSAENGLTYYDFTIGNEDYKGRLGATANDLVEIITAGSWRGVPTVAAAHLKAWIKRQPLLVATFGKARDMREKIASRQRAA